MTDTEGLIEELRRYGKHAVRPKKDVFATCGRAADALAAQAEKIGDLHGQVTAAQSRYEALELHNIELDKKISEQAGEIGRLRSEYDWLQEQQDEIRIVADRIKGVASDAYRAALEEAITAVRRAQPYDQNGDVVLFNTATAAIRALTDKEPT